MLAKIREHRICPKHTFFFLLNFNFFLCVTLPARLSLKTTHETHCALKGFCFDIGEPCPASASEHWRKEWPSHLWAETRCSHLSEGSRAARLIELREGPEEAQPEGALEEALRALLALREAEKGHAAQVVLGARQHEQVPLVRPHRRPVVTAHQGQVCQHARLPVRSQVPRAAYELLPGEKHFFVVLQSWYMAFFLGSIA